MWKMPEPSLDTSAGSGYSWSRRLFPLLDVYSPPESSRDRSCYRLSSLQWHRLEASAECRARHSGGCSRQTARTGDALRLRSEEESRPAHAAGIDSPTL